MSTAFTPAPSTEPLPFLSLTCSLNLINLIIAGECGCKETSKEATLTYIDLYQHATLHKCTYKCVVHAEICKQL